MEETAHQQDPNRQERQVQRKMYSDQEMQVQQESWPEGQALQEEQAPRAEQVRPEQEPIHEEDQGQRQEHAQQAEWTRQEEERGRQEGEARQGERQGLQEEQTRQEEQVPQEEEQTRQEEGPQAEEQARQEEQPQQEVQQQSAETAKHEEDLEQAILDGPEEQAYPKTKKGKKQKKLKKARTMDDDQTLPVEEERASGSIEYDQGKHRDSPQETTEWSLSGTKKDKKKQKKKKKNDGKGVAEDDRAAVGTDPGGLAAQAAENADDGNRVGSNMEGPPGTDHEQGRDTPAQADLKTADLTHNDELTKDELNEEIEKEGTSRGKKKKKKGKQKDLGQDRNSPSEDITEETFRLMPDDVGEPGKGEKKKKKSKRAELARQKEWTSQEVAPVLFHQDEGEEQARDDDVEELSGFREEKGGKKKKKKKDKDKDKDKDKEIERANVAKLAGDPRMYEDETAKMGEATEETSQDISHTVDTTKSLGETQPSSAEIFQDLAPAGIPAATGEASDVFQHSPVEEDKYKSCAQGDITHSRFIEGLEPTSDVTAVSKGPPGDSGVSLHRAHELENPDEELAAHGVKYEIPQLIGNTPDKHETTADVCEELLDTNNKDDDFIEEAATQSETFVDSDPAATAETSTREGPGRNEPTNFQLTPDFEMKQEAQPMMQDAEFSRGSFEAQVTDDNRQGIEGFASGLDFGPPADDASWAQEEISLPREIRTRRSEEIIPADVQSSGRTVSIGNADPAAILDSENEPQEVVATPSAMSRLSEGATQNADKEVKEVTKELLDSKQVTFAENESDEKTREATEQTWQVSAVPEMAIVDQTSSMADEVSSSPTKSPMEETGRDIRMNTWEQPESSPRVATQSLADYNRDDAMIEPDETAREAPEILPPVASDDVENAVAADPSDISKKDQIGTAEGEAENLDVFAADFAKATAAPEQATAATAQETRAARDQIDPLEEEEEEESRDNLGDLGDTLGDAQPPSTSTFAPRKASKQSKASKRAKASKKRLLDDLEQQAIGLPTSSTYDPVNDKGKGAIRDMDDVFVSLSANHPHLTISTTILT